MGVVLRRDRPGIGGVGDKMVRIVPLAPIADEAGLDQSNHVAIGLQVRLQLRQVQKHVRFVGIAVWRIERLIGIGEADDGFQSRRSQRIEVGLHIVQIRLADRAGDEIVQIE